jgi:hypothetical protein
MADATTLRLLAEKVLRNYPEFMLDYDPTATHSGGYRFAVRRLRKAYGSFTDSDKMRQVQRDLMQALRLNGYSVRLGTETRDDFILRVKLPPPPQVNLQEEVARVIREREDSNQKVGDYAKKAGSAN